jgi:hypothetical protein
VQPPAPPPGTPGVPVGEVLEGGPGVPPPAPLPSVRLTPSSVDGTGLSQVLRAVVFDRAGSEIASLDAPEMSLSGFSLSARVDARQVEDLQRSLRSGTFADNLDRLRNEVRENFALEQSLSVSVAGVSLGLSLVYVLWLIRGGVLMGSYLSALPAWRILDPLPVLARPGDDEEQEEDEIVGAEDRGRDVLRGFG